MTAKVCPVCGKRDTAKHDRRNMVLRLKSQGLTWVVIGVRLGISRQAAQQMARRAKREVEHGLVKQN